MAPGKPVIAINHYQSFTRKRRTGSIFLGGRDFIDYKNDLISLYLDLTVFGFTDTSLPLVLNPENTTTTDWLDLVEQPGSISNTDLSHYWEILKTPIILFLEITLIKRDC